MTDRQIDRCFAIVLGIALAVGMLACGLMSRAPGAEPEVLHFVLNDFALSREYDPMPGGWLLSFDGSRRVPAWTLERLTSRSFGDARREDQKFHHDDHEQKEFASSPDDYNGFTGLYDRGHLASAANHNDTPEHLHATFTIRNSVPQAKLLNERLWLRLEEHVRSLCVPGTTVWVVSLPVWTPDGYPKSLGKRDATYSARSIGDNHQEVPPHCGKSICVQHGTAIEVHSWLMPNEDPAEGKTFDDYLVTTDELEALAGFNLWKALPDTLQKKAEAAK